MGRRPGAKSPAPTTRLPLVHLAADRPRGVVAAHLRAGRWQKVGYGTYLPVDATPDPAAFDARTLALARVAGVARRLRAPVVFSHVSAALLWGLPLLRTPAHVHVMHPSRASARSDGAIVRHTARLDDDDVRSVAGVRVTSLERTLLDCAAMLAPVAGLVVADAALAAGADPEDVARRAHDAHRARHAVRMRAVVAYADPGAESPYETVSRFVVLRDGLPLPQTQVPVRTHLGTVWSDWGWAEFAVLAEYDGEGKYRGAESATFMAEKRRHDALQEAGQRVVRVVSADLGGSALSARILPLLPASVQRSVRPRPDLLS